MLMVLYALVSWFHGFPYVCVLLLIGLVVQADHPCSRSILLFLGLEAYSLSACLVSGTCNSYLFGSLLWAE